MGQLSTLYLRAILMNGKLDWKSKWFWCIQASYSHYGMMKIVKLHCSSCSKDIHSISQKGLFEHPRKMSNYIVWVGCLTPKQFLLQKNITPKFIYSKTYLSRGRNKFNIIYIERTKEDQKNQTNNKEIREDETNSTSYIHQKRRKEIQK